jgi:hypothetical protein
MCVGCCPGDIGSTGTFYESQRPKSVQDPERQVSNVEIAGPWEKYFE